MGSECGNDVEWHVTETVDMQDHLLVIPVLVAEARVRVLGLAVEAGGVTGAVPPAAPPPPQPPRPDRHKPWPTPGQGPSGAVKHPY